MSVESQEGRLRRVARLEPDEAVRAWTRGWVSRERRLHRFLASRNRDFAVLTDRRLLLCSSGFFTGRPRRRVVADRLAEVTTEPDPRRPGRVVRWRSPGHPALRLELGRGPRPAAFAAAWAALGAGSPTPADGEPRR